MSEEIQRTESPDLERGIASTWERLAPLSVGAVASSTAVILSSAALRRLLGGRGRILNWVGGAALISVGAWLLAHWAEDSQEEVGEGGSTERPRPEPDAEAAVVPPEPDPVPERREATDS